jgi:hypothetical protein
MEHQDKPVIEHMDDLKKAIIEFWDVLLDALRIPELADWLEGKLTEWWWLWWF